MDIINGWQMGIVFYIGVVLEKVRRFFGPRIITETGIKPMGWDDLTVSQRYVNLLLLDMCERGEMEIALAEGEPLRMGFEGFDDADIEGVTYAGIRDWLQEMVTSSGSNGEQYIDLVLVGKPMACQVAFGDSAVGLVLSEKA